MQNALRQREGLKRDYDETQDEIVHVLINTDTTFNLITEGWCQGSLNARGNRRVRGKMTGESMPICYNLSRTETGLGVARMFTAVRSFLVQFENGFQFYWNTVVSDHHDGVITAVLSIPQGRRNIFSQAIFYIVGRQCSTLNYKQ